MYNIIIEDSNSNKFYPYIKAKDIIDLEEAFKNFSILEKELDTLFEQRFKDLKK